MPLGAHPIRDSRNRLDEAARSLLERCQGRRTRKASDAPDRHTSGGSRASRSRRSGIDASGVCHRRVTPDVACRVAPSTTGFAGGPPPPTVSGEELNLAHHESFSPARSVGGAEPSDADGAAGLSFRGRRHPGGTNACTTAGSKPTLPADESRPSPICSPDCGGCCPTVRIRRGTGPGIMAAAL